MNITAVKIYPFDTGNVQSSLRVYADVTLDDFIVIKDFRVLVTKPGGLFVGMPSKMGKDEKYYEIGWNIFQSTHKNLGTMWVNS